MTEDSTSSTTATATSSSSTAAQDAVRKAQEIVARLSNQYPIVVADGTSPNNIGIFNSSSNMNETPSTMTDTTTTATKSTSSKRKRWGVMSENDTTEVTKRHNTDGTTNNNNNNINPVMANAQIPIAQLLMGISSVPSGSGGIASGTTPTTTTTDVIIKRLWVTVNHERPAAHYIAYMIPKLRRIVAQVNGTPLPPEEEEENEDEKDATQEDTINNHNSQDNDTDEHDTTKLRIVFKGKGSTNIPPLPGVPEEPLHIYMTGPKALMDTTTTNQVDALIHEASHAEPLIAAVIAAQQAQERALITTMESIQTNTYQPMSVTSLIHGNNSNDNSNKDSNQLLALPADRLAAALLHGTTAALTQEMEVPNHVVGSIIGRGGETIAAIQAQTNCKLQIQKEQDMVPGQIHRIITLSANTQAAIDACQSIVQSLVQERIQKMNAASSGNHYGSGGSQSTAAASNQIVLLDGSTVPSHHSLVEVLVPDADVGLVIGKGGVTIKQIQEQSGANVHVPKSANIDNPTVRTLQVTCPNLDGANLAKQLIEDVLKTKPGFGGANGGMNSYQQQQQQQVALQVSVPDKDVGLCIGRGGCVIKYMQSTTHTRIQIPPTVPNPGDMYRIITVTGPNMEACQQVQSMIHRILSEQSSAGVMSGNHQQQQAQYGSQAVSQYTTGSTQPQVNQPGYTAEWAAYHAAQQQQQQQQVQYQETAAAAAAVTATPEVAATTAAAAATNEYTEPFFRYAYYYGEDAARQYYGAWSPPVGTPNPYGINPNGITTPTTAAATTATESMTDVATTGNQNYGSTEQQQSNTSAAAPTVTTTAADDADAAAARETSRRHVSNLPAWMTKK